MHQPARLEESLPASRAARITLGIGVGVWLAAAFAIAAAGALASIRPLVPIVVFGTIGAGVLAYRRNAALRELADRIDLRIPILFHVLRAAIGAKILIATNEGVIPELFGHRAGPGDIAIGALALVVAAAYRSKRVVIAWCVLGILDLVVAFSTGQYLFWVVEDPRMVLIGAMPWSLLPAIIVPAMILTHLLVIARVRRRIS
jgi:hypothetical protein